VFKKNHVRRNTPFPVAKLPEEAAQ